MQLVHYSHEPVLAVHSVKQSDETETYGKPKGFWISVDGNGDGWRDWCEGEEFRLKSLTHVHDITLADNANILSLNGPYGIDNFTRQFGVSDPYGFKKIRWRDVAAQWQGIIIAPYVGSRRLCGGAYWYYSWDCASGCIWDADAIASITLREVVPVKVSSREAA